ncbi:sulfotransferase [Egicoccus sp. AB-alg6-2]|uniref:sulfotransferase n=1 Tax=Egicoccus sp. AB-alg6-2 TaxID=3242692 RepID=UPI00359EAD68
MSMSSEGSRADRCGPPVLTADRRQTAAEVGLRLAALRERRAGRTDPQLCDRVRDLVVVCSSSRSGSSLLGALLRRSPDLLSTSAEINPHFLIPALDLGPDVAPDLVADPSPVVAHGAGREVTRTELALDLGQPVDLGDAARLDVEAFADHVTWRLTMQWPGEAVDPRHVAAVVQACGVPGGDLDTWFVSCLLPAMRAEHPTIDPARYDLPADLRVPEPRAFGGPPATIVEMAPFVVPGPWRHATPAETASLPVVLSTPRNAFRLPLLASLFPAARIRVLHLVRNPAASVNGLRDGWLHPDFLTCRMPGGLHIDGLDVPEERADHWCFDLPPDWRELTARSLPEVCAEQWCRANEATIAGANHLDVARHVVHFEDLTGPRNGRRAALRAVADFLGIAPGPLTSESPLPVVMATAAPRPGRWRDNAPVLDPVLRDPAVRETATRLGYEPDPDTWT